MHKQHFFGTGCHFWPWIHLDEVQIGSDGWTLLLSLWLNMLNPSRPKFLSSDSSSLVMLLSSTVNLFCLIHVSLKRYHSSPYWPVQWHVVYLRARPHIKFDDLTHIGTWKAANFTKTRSFRLSVSVFVSFRHSQKLLLKRRIFPRFWRDVVHEVAIAATARLQEDGSAPNWA